MSPPAGLARASHLPSNEEVNGRAGHGDDDDSVRMPDGALVAKRDAPVGGQAVLEGVMMRGISVWAVAVRTPEGQIEVESESIKPWAQRHRVYRLPIVRGVVALAESMKIGFKALAISANAQLEEDEDGEKEEIGGFVWGFTIFLSLLLAVGLFFVVPVGLTSLIKDQLGSPLLFWLIEGLLRTAIFIAYLLAISKMPDLRRVFEYHGAEHKTISCYEAEDELTPARAKLYSRLHPRCGTSFLLIVMVLAISRKLVPQALGARGDVAGPDAPEPHHPRAGRRPARGRDRLSQGGPRPRGPDRGGEAAADRDRRLAASADGWTRGSKG